jgi:hypothetical protein
MNELEFHISPVCSSSRPQTGVGIVDTKFEQPSRTFGVVAQVLRALDRLGKVGDDAVAPASQL